MWKEQRHRMVFGCICPTLPLFAVAVAVMLRSGLRFVHGTSPIPQHTQHQQSRADQPAPHRLQVQRTGTGTRSAPTTLNILKLYSAYTYIYTQQKL
mmetsp:Transcript_58520/g.130386  ORF Transcript_58520/g.130386 Transcript_58520/m.130386 type:complete len:96 (-) Transcript_58520:46-333(-)